MRHTSKGNSRWQKSPAQAGWHLGRAFPAALLWQQMEGWARREDAALTARGASDNGLCWLCWGWQSWARCGGQGWGERNKREERWCQRYHKNVSKAPKGVLRFFFALDLLNYFFQGQNLRNVASHWPVCAHGRTHMQRKGFRHFVNLCKTFRDFKPFFLLLLRQIKLKSLSTPFR